MKKRMVCNLCLRHSLALSNGRISSTAAPVVPRTLASIAPTNKIAVLIVGAEFELETLLVNGWSVKQ